jgi:hypothetical protein
MIDFYSQAWHEFAATVEKLRAQESLKLESAAQGFHETQFIRGKIAAYRDLLALPKHSAARAMEDRPELGS